MLIEGTLDPDVVDGRVGRRLEETVIGRVGRRLEGLDPDVVDGRVRGDVGSGRC